MPAVPATCQKFLNNVKGLLAQIAKIQSGSGFIQGPRDPHPGKPDPESLAEVKALEKKIAGDMSSFQQCLLKNLKPFPLKITVSSITSIKGTSEIGDDAPYVIVTACDLSTVVPGVESTLYGPVKMGAGQTRSPGGRPFWFIDNTSGKAIPDLSKVIFVVSLMENDDGSPSAARGLVKGATEVSLAGSLNLPRAKRVQKLLADIDSALAIPTGAPNFDDQIGNSMELTLSNVDLVLPVVGPHTVGLTFSGDGQFSVSCLITQA